MRLLVVGHSYITAFAQGKYAAMKQAPGTQIRIVIPHEVPHVFMRFKREVAPGLNEEDVVSLGGWFKSHMLYVLNPLSLASLLKKFKPDHIHIEEDPHSLIGVETVLLARIICPNVLVSFFIWDNLARKPRFPLNFIKLVLTKYSLSRSSMVVCGNQDAELLLKNNKGYKGATIVLPQVGLNPEEYEKAPPMVVQKNLAKGFDDVLVGFFGRLVNEKGITQLLEALSRLPFLPWKLLVIGSGPLKDEIQTHWKNLLGNRIIIQDALPHNEVPYYLKCIDIFVLPSYATPLWKEQFGLTLAQAMMAGVACIGSSSGQIPNVLGGSGIIFKEGDVESLKSALKVLIESRELRMMNAKGCREFAIQHYTNDAVASAYQEVFDNLKIRE